MFTRVMLVLAVLLCPGFALAEKFLGYAEDEAPPEERPVAQAERPASDPQRGRVGVSGGLGAGSGFFEGSLTVIYFFNRFVSIDTTGFYYRRDENRSKEESYGPEIDLVLRLANPTIVTPFVGGGPGAVFWKRTFEGEVFDESNAMTASVFGGASIALTRYFGLQFTRKQTRYLMDPPKSFDDRATRESKTQFVTSIGFRVFL